MKALEDYSNAALARWIRAQRLEEPALTGLDREWRELAELGGIIVPPAAASPEPTLATVSPLLVLRAMVDAAEHHGATIVYVVGRDKDDHILSVGVVAEGADAISLHRWLEDRGEL